MNKTELVSAIAEEAGITKKDATSAVDAFIKVTTDTLVKKERLQLIGFGTFEAKERSARTGHNPQTGEEMEIPAATVPAFRPGKALKEAVNVKEEKKKSGKKSKAKSKK